MKYNEKSKQIETNLNNETQNFKIAMNSKTFRLLSDTLYSDKIKAIIRELSCNAYDSHVEAKNLEKKFELKLPTFIDKEFSIRDYGIGMSNEKLTTLYLTYGESSKNNSNELVGCFGIGSKSPFAYVDMFNVTSYYEGYKSVFSVFLNNGIPQCILIDKTKTNEETGIKISFVVDEKDIIEFEKKAKEVFQNFEVEPICNIDLKIEKPSFDINNEHYSVNVLNGKNNLFAYQGNICYPIDKSFLKKFSEFNFGTIILKFNIGDFSFAPSREALSYDKKTIKIINKKFEEVVLDIYKYIAKDILNSKSLLEYRKKYINYFNKTSFEPKIMEKFELYSFKGIKTNHHDMFYFNPFKKGMFYEACIAHKKSFSLKENCYNINNEYSNKQPVVLINDLNIDNSLVKTLNKARKLGYIGSRNIFLVKESDVDYNEFVNIFGDDFNYLSKYIKYDLIKEDVKKIIPRKNSFNVIQSSSSITTKSVFDKNKKYVYIPFSKKDRYGDFEINILDYKKYFSSYRLFMLKNIFINPEDELILISKEKIHYFEQKNLIKFEDYVLDKNNIFFKDNLKYFKYFELFRFFKTNSYLDFFSKNINKLLKLNPLFKEVKIIIDLYKSENKLFKSYDSSDIIAILNDTLNKLNVNLDQSKKEFFDLLPLAKLINLKNEENYESFKNYINLICSKNNSNTISCI